MNDSIKRVVVLAIAAAAAGCAGGPAVPKPVAVNVEVPGEIAATSRPLKFLVMWYYRASKSWPEERSDLVDFIRMLEAPLSLDNYLEIRFAKLSDEYLECRYLFEASDELCEASGGKVPGYRINGMFSVTQAETATDGVAHVDLEPMLTLESILLPESCPEQGAPGNEKKPGPAAAGVGGKPVARDAASDR